jgi:heat shock protein HslJ
MNIQTKHLVIALGFLVIVTLGVSMYTVMQDREDGGVSRIEDSKGEPITDTTGVGGKLKADTFTGTLERVDTGCFADGECYIVVDGKHVTALQGWSQETVGSVMTDDGFGGLEKYIGKQVEVYAQVTGEGEYTLYGSEGFYIKPVLAVSNEMITIDEGDRVSNQLEGKTFVWEKTVSSDTRITTPNTKDAFTFTIKNGQVSGGTDCNGYSGDVTLTGTSIAMGAFMSTMMYCEGSQEAVFTGALSAAETYRFEGEKLVLTGSNGFPQVWLVPQALEVEPFPPITAGGCMTGGCSGQLCVDAKTGGDMVTTCEYRAEYACYQGATCERQATGQCGWTSTPELSQCLLEAKNNPSSMDLQVN